MGSTLSLARYLREHLHLTGTKVSCGMGGCGACTVEAAFREGGGKRVVRSVNACLVPVLSCDEWEITTVEGIGSRRTGLSDVQSRVAIQSNLKMAKIATKEILTRVFKSSHMLNVSRFSRNQSN